MIAFIKSGSGPRDTLGFRLALALLVDGIQRKASKPILGYIYPIRVINSKDLPHGNSHTDHPFRASPPPGWLL